MFGAYRTIYACHWVAAAPTKCQKKEATIKYTVFDLLILIVSRAFCLVIHFACPFAQMKVFHLIVALCTHVHLARLANCRFWSDSRQKCHFTVQIQTNRSRSPMWRIHGKALWWLISGYWHNSSFRWPKKRNPFCRRTGYAFVETEKFFYHMLCNRERNRK